MISEQFYFCGFDSLLVHLSGLKAVAYDTYVVTLSPTVESSSNVLGRLFCPLQ